MKTFVYDCLIIWSIAFHYYFFYIFVIRFCQGPKKIRNITKCIFYECRLKDEIEWSLVKNEIMAGFV